MNARDKTSEASASQSAGSRRAPPPPVIFTVFQTGREANGGVESITQIIERLEALRPIVITQRETGATARWRERGLEVHVWPVPNPPEVLVHARDLFISRTQRLLPLIGWNRRVLELIRRTGARIVHCNDIGSYWHTVLGARAGGAKVVFNIRDVFPEEQQYGWKWRLTRSLSESVVVLSDEMKTIIETRMPAPRGARNAGVISIYSPVDLVRMAPASLREREERRRRLGIRDGEIAVGYIGTFNKKKNQLEFITKTLPALLSREPRARVHFLGDFEPEIDSYARECQRAVVRFVDPQRVQFNGISREMHDWYSSFDLVCLASRYEGLARCMIESAACGTAVVSFDVCSAREILERHNAGVVVRQGDHALLASVAADLLASPDRRVAMGRAGAALARDLFDPVRVNRQYEALYEGMLK